MTLMMTTGLGLALLATGISGHLSPDKIDPLSPAFPSALLTPQMRVLISLARSEPRDNVWADRTEQGLRNAYIKAGPHVAHPTALKVACSATLCEVAGTYQPFSLPRSQPEIDELGQQLATLKEALAALGLKNDLGMASGSELHPTDMAFEAIYRRSVSAE